MKPLYDHLMVIEDSDIDRYVAQHILKFYNPQASVLLMQSGIEALEYLRHNSNDLALLPQLILLDFRMPIMDGFAFLEEFKNLPVLFQEQCRIVALSNTINYAEITRIECHPLIWKFR